MCIMGRVFVPLDRTNTLSNSSGVWHIANSGYAVKRSKIETVGSQIWPVFYLILRGRPPRPIDIFLRLLSLCWAILLQTSMTT